MPECSIEGCSKKAIGRGWCSKHYQRWQRHGHPLTITQTEAGEPARFLDDIISAHLKNPRPISDPCIIYPYGRGSDGSALLKYKGQTRRGIRVVCEGVNGPPPTPEHQAAHYCGKDHEGCVAPHHLRWATPLENMKDLLVHGTGGQNHPNAKLTDEDALEVKIAYLRKENMMEMARRKGVSRSAIYQITHGITFQHIKVPDNVS